MPLKLATLSCLLVVLAAGTRASAAGLPEKVREVYRERLETLSRRHLLSPKRARGLRQDLVQEKPFAESVALLHRLVQAFVDADHARTGVLLLRAALQQPGMADFREVAFPSEIEVTRLTLKDGRSLLVTTRSLQDSWGKLLSKGQIAGQESVTFELCFVAEKGRMWVAREQVKKRERVKISIPKRWVVQNFGERVDEDGRLDIDALWFVPNSVQPDRREQITLDLVHMTPGRSLFQNEAHGLVAARLTQSLKGLSQTNAHTPEFDRAAGWSLPPPLEVPPPPAQLLAQIARLRQAAPQVEWPEPFDPEPEFAAWTAAEKDLVDAADPAGSLLRLRHALCYGPSLPDLARRDPQAWLTLEAAVQAFLLAEGPLSAVTAITTDWELVAEVVRHAPRFAPAPPSEFAGPNFRRFPERYSGWRKWPILVALHTQGSGRQVIEIEASKWATNLGQRRDPVLLVPDFGSRRGAPRSHADDQKILGAIRGLLLRYQIDPDRVYLTGMSMGGAKSWYLASTYPGKWAAVAPRGHGPAWVVQRGSRVSFPLRTNLERVPLYAMLGQFEGLNSVYTHRIMRELREKKAPATFHSFAYVGHSELSWHLPWALRWALQQRRDPHPAQVRHVAYHDWTGGQAWLSIKDVRRGGKLWRARDGGFGVSLATGVQATYAKGHIKLKVLTGRPDKVELHYDPVLMTESSLKISLRGRTLMTWEPEPSIRRLLERVRRSGDRSRLYPDSVTLSLR